VHLSFTWAGARAKTSFWTGKIGNIGAAPTPALPPPRPVPTPTPTTPGTVIPPLPHPVPAAVLPAGPELADEIVTVTAAGEGALTAGSLTAGQAYLVEASGTYRWGTRSGQVADPECSRANGDTTWRRQRSVHPWQPAEDHLDLYVDGVDLQGEPDLDAGDASDTRTHTYRWTYVPTRTGRVSLALWDPTTLTDNSGALTVRLVAQVPRERMTWQLPATGVAGVTSPGALENGGTYLLTVSGTVNAGGGVVSDAECSTSAADPVWRRDRSVLPEAPAADHLDVLVDRDDVTFTPVSDPDGDGCDADTHTYRMTLRPSSTSAVNLRVDDPAPGDDTGALTVDVLRVRPVVDTETVALDTSKPAVATVRNYLAGQTLRLTATGTWTYADGVTADAECSATTADPIWRSTRSTMLVDGRYLGDVTVNGSLPDWTQAGSGRCDPTTHAYSLTYTPRETGPLTLGVADLDLADTLGTVSVTIGPAG
jgi:hypothetical protein